MTQSGRLGESLAAEGFENGSVELNEFHSRMCHYFCVAIAGAMSMKLERGASGVCADDAGGWNDPI